MWRKINGQLGNKTMLKANSKVLICSKVPAIRSFEQTELDKTKKLALWFALVKNLHTTLFAVKIIATVSLKLTVKLL